MAAPLLLAEARTNALMSLSQPESEASVVQIVSLSFSQPESEVSVVQIVCKTSLSVIL